LLEPCAGTTRQHGSEGAGPQQCGPATRLLSPLLANIALSVLDEHFTAAWAAMGDSSARHRRRHRGEATYRLVRYADDFVVLVNGTRAHAEQLRDEAAAVLAPMGLALSAEKTRVCHLDDGFDFLGFRIQRQPKRGSGKLIVYTWPTKKALCTVKAKVRTATRQGLHQPLAVLLYRLAPILRGLDQLLPLRGVQGDLRLPAPLHLASGPAMASPQTPPRELEVDPTPLPARVVANRW
jgi:Reverse transcriptase (RNA-dependent DNA polymerase)